MNQIYGNENENDYSKDSEVKASGIGNRSFFNSWNVEPLVF